MHIWISGVTAVFGITQLRWLHHQCELGGDSGTLHFVVSWFRRKLSVNFSYQTSRHSNVLSAVNMKSQFDIYFTSHKTQPHKTNYTCSKLNEEFQISVSIAKCQFHIYKVQLVKCWEFFMELILKYFVPPPSWNLTSSNLFSVHVA